MTESASGKGSPGFFFGAALAVLAIGLLGFGPSFVAGVAAGFETIPWRVHLHGALMVGWLLLLTVQAFLIWRGIPAPHRTLGKLGVGLFVLAYVSMAILALNNLMKTVPPFVDEGLGRVFALQLTTLLSAPVLFVLAIRYARRDTEAHRRLMVLISAIFLGAAIIRMDWLPGIEGLATGILTLAGYSLLPLLMVPAYDLVKLRRLHPATMLALGIFAAGKVFAIWAWSSPSWMAFTRSIEDVLQPFWPAL